MPRSHSSRFSPKLFTVLRDGYTLRDFSADLSAGVVVGLVALPLAIAFAIASGVKPEQGIYTAIVAGFVIALFGGSRVQVSGPTGAFIVVIYDIVQRHGYEGLAVATLLAGILLVAMGLARMGGVLKYIPYPLTVGFTSGIALIIFTSQVPDFFGVHIENPPADFIGKWAAFASNARDIDLRALLVGVFSLTVIVCWPRVTHRIPGSLVALAGATAIVHLFELPVATIGSRFGAVPSALPPPALPHLDWELVREMARPALTIALLGAIESLLSAMVADGMTGAKHRSNTELVAQGIGNIVSPLFAGIPATGAIARTATNVKNGARSPVAGMIHALVLLLVVLLFGSWAELVPMSALAAILVVAAWNMCERRNFIGMFRHPASDVAVMLTTFALTVLIDLTVAIEVGIVMSALLFLRRMAETSEVQAITHELFEDEDEPDDAGAIAGKRSVPPGVEVFEVFGPLFFGAVDGFKSVLSQVRSAPRAIVLRMRSVPAIDASGLRALEDLHAQARRNGTVLVLSGVKSQPRDAMERCGLLERLGAENVCPDIDAALARAAELPVTGAGGKSLSPAAEDAEHRR